MESTDGISTVPYVIWNTEEEAIKKLRAAGLGEPKIIREYDEKVEEGKVIEQSEESGKEVESGTVITLKVSLGSAGFATFSLYTTFTLETGVII